MKELFHEYGTGLLTAGIALLLFLFIFTRVPVGENAGLFSALSAGAKIEGEEYASYEDSRVSQNISAEPLPQIEYTGKVIRVGEKVDLEKLFTVRDGNGTVIMCEIIDLRDAQGNVMDFKESKKEFCFSKQGVYKICLKARDKEGGITRNIFSIPVTHGGRRSR